MPHLPLAIELAAARVRALSPRALVERLDQRFAVLAGGPVYEGGRHRTLETVVAWSYDLLAPAEADLFDRLAVFAGAVPLPAIEAVCADETLGLDRDLAEVARRHDLGGGAMEWEYLLFTGRVVS